MPHIAHFSVVSGPGRWDPGSWPERRSTDRVHRKDSPANRVRRGHRITGGLRRGALLSEMGGPFAPLHKQCAEAWRLARGSVVSEHRHEDASLPVAYRPRHRLILFREFIRESARDDVHGPVASESRIQLIVDLE